MSIIKAENLCKNYSTGTIETKVIKNISLEIEKGDFVSIVGPSGSGKSTLLYLLSGMEPYTSGSVIFSGKEISKLSDKEKCEIRRNKLGFVFQFYNLIAEMNVVDNVLLPVLVSKEKVDEKRLDDILKIVGMEKYKTAFPHELSGGQQQRVAIARAIYTNPEIIFADEPTGNLDSVTGKEIMELFKKINETQGTTIIQVTHSEKYAKYAKTIITLVDGEINKKDSQMYS